MEQVRLRARAGRVPGSRSSRRLRREGLVPAVVYGHELETLSISVDARELRAALQTDLGSNAVIYLEMDGADDILTLAREIVRHPFRPEYQHVDFVQVSLTETVTTEVVIHFEGEPIGAREGGVFSPRRTSVEIEAVVTNIPGSIPLDVSGVDIGESLRISDLPDIDGVTYLEDPESVVMSVTVPAAEIEEPEVADEELVDGEVPVDEEGAEEETDTADAEDEETTE